MARTKKTAFTVTTARAADAAPDHHFFVSSAAQWRVGYDVGALVAEMQKDPYPFNVWLVPGSKDADYGISMFAPQVEGATYLAFYSPN